MSSSVYKVYGIPWKTFENMINLEFYVLKFRMKRMPIKNKTKILINTKLNYL